MNQIVSPPAANLVWGAEAIGKAIGRTTRQTFHALEKGELAGAQKIARLSLAARRDAAKIRSWFRSDTLQGYGIFKKSAPAESLAGNSRHICRASFCG